MEVWNDVIIGITDLGFWGRFFYGNECDVAKIFCTGPRRY